MNRLRLVWINLRSSLWFLPFLLVFASILMAVALVEADDIGAELWHVALPRFLETGAEGARGMLSTIAGSMMSVVGVTFSMVLVVLSLASSQYTSRILRNFMRSRITQTVLGIFTGIYAYCLIVLRTIHSDTGDAFVPQMAVFFGFVLALAGVAILIYFLHHVATSIQASSVIENVAEETLAAIDRLYPDATAEEAEDETPDVGAGAARGLPWRQVSAANSGYVQDVDINALKSIATEVKSVIRMERCVGEFVVAGTAVASIALADTPEDTVQANIQAAFSIDRFRTVDQDMAFGIRQLVDVALKALSPGINDTTTAVSCVNYLAVILAQLAPRRFPPPRLGDDEGVRVITKTHTFAGLLDEAFNEIRRNAAGNVTVLVCLLNALHILMERATGLERRRAISNQARWISEIAGRTVDAPQDRAEIEAAIASIFDHVSGAEAGGTSD